MPKDSTTVLVVGRENAATRETIARLRAHDYAAIWARDGESALNLLDRRRVDALVVEVRAPRIDGLAVMQRALARNPATCTVLIAAGPQTEAAIDALRHGAHDVQSPPLHLDRLIAMLERGLAQQRLGERLDAMQARLDQRFGLGRLVAQSRAMRRVIEQVRHTAATRATVLIEGEPGTGKGLLAQVLHQHSPRKTGPFVMVDCGAVPDGLIESELFGDDSLDDASRRGRFELADGGTLFLTDVASIPLSAQVRLLRAIQDRGFERVGGTTTRRADVRLLAASERDLAAEVAAGRFRDDLARRLGVVRLVLPPLRERREDIPALVERFIHEANRAHRRRVTGITRGALERLLAHAWPGNVRELREAVERMVESTRGRRALDLSDLPSPLRPDVQGGEPLALAVGMTIDEAERHLILATLEHAGGDKVRAAQVLGIGLRTLYRKLQQYAIH